MYEKGTSRLDGGGVVRTIIRQYLIDQCRSNLCQGRVEVVAFKVACCLSLFELFEGYNGKPLVDKE
jgi:hypothetical protein